MDKIKSWITNHKLEFIILLLILLLGTFMRVFKINEYMTFLGDEGRDVIIVRRLLTEAHPPLIGPGTSIGNMYLGPLYYYLMAIPLLIANFNPVGPALFIAILGTITIYLLWFVVRKWFPTNKTNYGALAASFLYAISPVIIIYSRSSWNPNIMPFFSLLAIYAIWNVWVNKKFKWLIVAAISFAFVLQSHYIGLLLLPVIIITWFLAFLKVKNKRNCFIYSLISLVLFILLMSPLAIFDFRHNFINFNAIKIFFTERQATVSIKPWNAIPLMWPTLNMISADLVAAKNMAIGIFISIIFAISFVIVYLFKKEKYDEKKISIILILTMWLGFALIGFGLYKQHIYDHYFGFIFTTPFIIIGGLIQYFISKKKVIFYLLAVISISSLTIINFANSPLKFAPNKQLERAQVVARKVKEISSNEKFNFAIIAENNYDSAYRYFLNLDKAMVIDIDPQNTKDTITNQLIVVCEKEKSKCDPTHNPKAEIANFGWSKIEKEYDNVFGATIFKLVHSK